MVVQEYVGNGRGLERRAGFSGGGERIGIKDG